IKAAVDHVWNPGKGMPVRSVACAQGPENPRRRQPWTHMLIGNDVSAIVKGNKLMCPQLAVTKPGHDHEAEAKKKRESVPGKRPPSHSHALWASFTGLLLAGSDL